MMQRSLKTRLEAEFPVKGSELLLKIPLDKSLGASIALLVKYKCEHTNNIKHVKI